MYKPKVVETPKKNPWEQRSRNSTFTEVAGCLAFSSAESSPSEDLRRRQSIFDEANALERHAQAPSYRKTIPAFRGELKSLSFYAVNKFFTELFAYQSEHNTQERGAPHISWPIRSLLTPPGISDEVFAQIPNKDLFALIRSEI